MRQIASRDGTPTRRHFWWRQALRLQAHDPGVDEHLQLSELFEVAVEYNSLRVSELACFETASRRFQMWEEFYAAQLQQNEAPGGGLSMDERGAFLGHDSKLALVAPSLTEYVAKQLAERTSVLKERRKAGEQQAHRGQWQRWRCWQSQSRHDRPE